MLHHCCQNAEPSWVKLCNTAGEASPCCDWEPNFRHVENVKVELKAHLWLLAAQGSSVVSTAASHRRSWARLSRPVCSLCSSCLCGISAGTFFWRLQHATDMLAYFPTYSRISISFLRRKSCLFIVLITWLFNLTAGTKHGQSERAIFSCAAARAVSRAVSYLRLWNRFALVLVCSWWSEHCILSWV